MDPNGNVFAEGMMPGPDGMLLRFFYDSEKNEYASTVLGRAIFDTVLYVDLITPGQKSSTPRFEVERQFSEQSREANKELPPVKVGYKYQELREFVERFKRDEVAADMGGTPLKEWPRINRGLQATCYAANIFTVEQLANLSDTNLGYLGMGARELRAQAQEWIKSANGNADTSALVGELTNVKQENERLQADMIKMNAAMQEMQKKIDAANLPSLV